MNSRKSTKPARHPKKAASPGPSPARDRSTTRRALGALLLVLAACSPAPDGRPDGADEVGSPRPESGGRLVVALGGDPGTFNPLLARDKPSREVVGRMNADLVRINRLTQETESALAEAWTLSEDGRTFVLELRRDVRFSDGEPFDADDVVFTFEAAQDEAIGSSHRDLLALDGDPIRVRKLDSHTVEFVLQQPRAVGARIFDSVPILPEHLLRASYEQGALAEAWRLDAAPETIAGLGPFRLREYLPGERVVLERNPHYWKRDEEGRALPYLDEIVFRIFSSQDAEVLRFRAGELDAIDGLKAGDYAVLEAAQANGGYRLFDLGPGLEFTAVFFNLNPADSASAEAAARRAWFQNRSFRQAISAAIDRQGIARLVYQGRATPIWSHVSPGYEAWFHHDLPRPARSVDRARELLASAGFTLKGDALEDSTGRPVSFTLITNAGNAERGQMMTLIQEDLRQLGMSVQIVSLEIGTLVGRVLQSRDYDLCLLGLGGGDSDPNPLMNVLLSSGGMHLWNPGQVEPATAWEAEIDRLMTEQATELDYERRKALYDRVQEILVEERPMIPLVSPNILVGAKSDLGNFKPAILDHHTLWNAHELYWRDR